MLNNKIKAVQNNINSKYDRTQQNNIKNNYKKCQRPKVFFDISKHTRILEQDAKKIKSDAADIPELKSICDIDKTFYIAVEGRPIRRYEDTKVVIRNLRDCSLYRTNAAFFKDQIIKVDTNFADELREYDIVFKLFKETKSNYFRFIEKSFDIATEAQQRAEAVSEQLANKIDQLNSLSLVQVQLNNEICNLAVVFGSLIRYGRFLNQMSPVWWTVQHDIKNSEDFMKVIKEAESNPTQSFEIYKAYFIHASVRPKICFKKPQTLIRVFDEISGQCLNYKKILNYSDGIVRSVLKCRDQLEINILAEINEVTDLIIFYEQQIKCMEENEAEYKYKFNKIVLNTFYELYASYGSLKLFTCVQFVHFSLFQGPEDLSDNITTLVGDIEKLFVNLTSGLDYLDQRVVRAVAYEVFSSDVKIMRRATRARRILKECDILKKSLITSFEAPRYFHKKMSI